MLELQLRDVWPGAAKFERRCYALIRAAYVQARYPGRYRMTAETRAWIARRVEVLCGHLRLEQLEGAA
jgi:hypothetical protein